MEKNIKFVRKISRVGGYVLYVSVLGLYSVTGFEVNVLKYFVVLQTLFVVCRFNRQLLC